MRQAFQTVRCPCPTPPVQWLRRHVQAQTLEHQGLQKVPILYTPIPFEGSRFCVFARDVLQQTTLEHHPFQWGGVRGSFWPPNLAIYGVCCNKRDPTVFEGPLGHFGLLPGGASGGQTGHFRRQKTPIHNTTSEDSHFFRKGKLASFSSTAAASCGRRAWELSPARQSATR